ncbi:4Fe-4S dicluster domain-containing protein [Geovibrio thiophilus]|uniref:4Fe-4S dicluster domain-containing protein n=1 Tax=Geovibrio thiophilus TaxID=139438 RepID=A0A410K234_9BACT|nr:4Fe-4S dicluster domain-containing protein [Geovibrio thiophilus]
MSITTSICIGCSVCINECNYNVLSLSEEKAEVVDRGACNACGKCEDACPTGAINVYTVIDLEDY